VTRPWRLGAENTDTYGKQELHEKVARVTALLPRVFEWARAIHPTQPLTSGVCYVESNLDGWNLGTLAQIQLRESDIVTFHNYGGPESFPEAGEVAEALWSTGHLHRVAARRQPEASSADVKSRSTWLQDPLYIVGHTEPRLPTHHPDVRLRSLLDLDVTVIARSLSYRWISGIDSVTEISNLAERSERSTRRRDVDLVQGFGRGPARVLQPDHDVPWPAR
jgi:hypothetical protein